MKAPVDPWAHTAETVLAIGGREFSIVHPAKSDDLISEADYVHDERLPYWADIWPSSRVLAEVVLRTHPGHDKSLLELGCGLGLVSLAATLAGFRVLASDYYDAALSFARHNVRRNTVNAVELKTLLLNWREMPGELSGFDYVVAFDVLYEKEYGSLVAEIFSRLLAPSGTAIMADPGRIAVGAFLSNCKENGLNLFAHQKVPIVDDGRSQTVDIYTFTKVTAT